MYNNYNLHFSDLQIVNNYLQFIQSPDFIVFLGLIINPTQK